MHITIISASTRTQRLSHRVALALEAAINQRPGFTASILDMAAYQFPIMEETIKKLDIVPDGLLDFAQQLRASDAHIFVSPEYNGSYTAALKNALDYLDNQELKRKVIAVSSVTTGPLGGMRGALAMQQLALAVGGIAIPDMLLVPLVDKKFDAEGALIDPAFEGKFNNFMGSFLWTAQAIQDAKTAQLVTS
jgi:NAD(P)H-dependent FMN reductase